MDEESSEKKLNKVLSHIRENKTAYIIGGICLSAGIVIGVLSSRKGIQIVDNFNVKVKSPTNNVVITQLTRRGHPGNVVLCNETGEIFASQKRAALANDVPVSSLSNHLAGHQSSVDGLTFTKLGEAS